MEHNVTYWRVWLFQDLSSLGATNDGGCNTNARRAIVAVLLHCIGGESFLSRMVTGYKTCSATLNPSVSRYTLIDAIRRSQGRRKERFAISSRNCSWNRLAWNDIILANFSPRIYNNDIWSLESSEKIWMLAFIKHISQETFLKYHCFMTVSDHIQVCAPLRPSQSSDERPRRHVYMDLTFRNCASYI
jgi:hypothetical protein